VEILTQVEDGIGWIALNRPETRNAINKSMWDALPGALRAVQGEGARVAVFQGEGGAFASGADLCELEALDSPAAARAHWLSIRNALNAVANFQLPTIAMVNGVCVGGGCLLACACDIRYCESDSKFCIPVGHLGIVLDDDNLARLLSLIGRGAAAELLMTADIISAQRALEIGLVNRVVPAAELHFAVKATAESIRRNVAASMTATKAALVRLSTNAPKNQDQAAMVASYLSDEFRQRVAKALSKTSTFKPE
jgi:enoyl-CoA hydratase/carnithine racemase